MQEGRHCEGERRKSERHLHLGDRRAKDVRQVREAGCEDVTRNGHEEARQHDAHVHRRSVDLVGHRATQSQSAINVELNIT